MRRRRFGREIDATGDPCEAFEARHRRLTPLTVSPYPTIVIIP